MYFVEEGGLFVVENVYVTSKVALRRGRCCWDIL